MFVNQLIFNIGVGISDVDMFVLVIGYFVIDYIVIEFIVGILLKFDIIGKGQFLKFGMFGCVYQWSFVFFFKYYFNDVNVKFCLYVGVGVMYIWFIGVKIMNSMFENGVFGGLISVMISNQWVFVFNVGFMYNFMKYWFVGFLMLYILVSVMVIFMMVCWILVGMLMEMLKVYILLNLIVMYLNVGYCF